jgi:hypothetical protein
MVEKANAAIKSYGPSLPEVFRAHRAASADRKREVQR